MGAFVHGCIYAFLGICISLPEASLSFPGITLAPRHHSRSQASTQPRPAHVAGDVAKSPILRGAVSIQPRFVPPKKMSLSRRALSGSLPCQIPNCVSQHAPRLLSCTSAPIDYEFQARTSEYISDRPRHPSASGFICPCCTPLYHIFVEVEIP
jgi:hypothetical protein